MIFFNPNNGIPLVVLFSLYSMKVLGLARPLTAPLFKFGVVADIQYIDAPDGSNFQKNKIRRYRQSLQIFKDAVSSWKQLDDCIKFSIVLGDTLDGQTYISQTQEKCLTDVKNIMMGTKFPFHFCFGNHDFYAFNRSQILSNFIHPGLKSSSKSDCQNFGGPCTEEKLYYDFSPHPGYRCVVLDSYDVSIIGASSDESKLLAEKLLKENNHNDLKKSGTWFDNLPFEKYRWVPYNGGIGTKQVEWLKSVLSHSRDQSEIVFIFCHQSIYAPDQPQSVVWNAEEILQIVQDSGNVCLWVAGHDHDGQYTVDSTGIHHMVPPAPLECDEGQTSYGHVEVHKDMLKLCWTGKIPSASLDPWPTEMMINKRTGSSIDI